MVCKGGLSGLMSIQRTATFQTYGIKPGFNDMVKATKLLSSSVSVVMSLSESSGVKR